MNDDNFVAGGSGHYDESQFREEMERSVRSFLDEHSFIDEGGSMAESMFSSANEEIFVMNNDAVPDVMMLNVLCARAKAPKDTEESLLEAEQSWGPVRDWLSSHNADEVRAAAEQRGESGLTALHFAARHDPPLDVIDVLLSIAQDTVQWPDSFGWLPIHYACASGSDTVVIKTLAEAYPESKTTVDRRGRTPLHFALGDKPASPDVIFLLSSSGAAMYPDEIGMLVRKKEICAFLIHIT
jgi:Ankyrin repeats (3 copies)